jgi:hypothetical protein
MFENTTQTYLTAESTRKARLLYKTKLVTISTVLATNFLTKGLRSKRRRFSRMFQVVEHSRTQSPSYARSTERDEGLWPNPYQTGI